MALTQISLYAKERHHPAWETWNLFEKLFYYLLIPLSRITNPNIDWKMWASYRTTMADRFLNSDTISFQTLSLFHNFLLVIRFFKSWLHSCSFFFLLQLYLVVCILVIIVTDSERHKWLWRHLVQSPVLIKSN